VNPTLDLVRQRLDVLRTPTSLRMPELLQMLIAICCVYKNKRHTLRIIYCCLTGLTSLKTKMNRRHVRLVQRSIKKKRSVVLTGMSVLGYASEFVKRYCWV
jgi:hypothetical protein